MAALSALVFRATSLGPGLCRDAEWNEGRRWPAPESRLAPKLRLAPEGTRRHIFQGHTISRAASGVNAGRQAGQTVPGVGVGPENRMPPMSWQAQLATAAFLLVPAAICYWLKLGLTRSLLLAGVRACLQLLLIGLGLRYLFEMESVLPIVGCITVMVAIAGSTAAGRAKGVPNALPVATTCILAAAVLALTASVWLGVLPLRARFVIPIAGIVVGSTMTIAANTMQRLADDMRTHRGQVEAALALGATPQQSYGHLVRRAVEVGVGPTLDYSKTVGLIQIPGAMTGMLLGGASVPDAVALQIVVTLVLFGCCILSCILAAYLSAPQFFSRGSLVDLP